MPSADAISSASGRNSRASNISANTGASRSHRSPPPHDSWTNAGVLSMLKTSTDTGDIGALSFNTSRLPTLPRNAHTKRGHVKRPSTSAPPHHNPAVSSKHSYAPSQNSRISSQWDASSTHRRGSLTSMQSNPPAIPQVHLSGKPSLTTIAPPPDTRRDSRSYSMTSALPGQPLPRHQSATSLKSQGHEPRHGSRMAGGGLPPSGMSDNRPIFVYPTRLKRPGYRSPSPALSDTYAGHAPPPGTSSMGRGMPAPRGPHPGPYNGYNAGYTMEFVQDPHHLNVRPPARTANSSPNNVGFETNHCDYRTGHSRHIPSFGLPHQMLQPIMHPGPPTMHANHNQVPRAQYGPQYAGRPGYTPYTHVQHSSQRGPSGAPNAVPMAHQMFHNAARMARHLPHRTDTPMTDMSPPSSDPPSSSSAPTSSSPSTPKDDTSIRVTVDPAFIDPALMDLPNSSSKPVLPAKYFEYADGPLDEQDIEVLRPSVPASGFVQRVKAMLETNAMVQAAAEGDCRKTSHQALMHNHQLMQRCAMEDDQDEVSELQEFHEMAANETPRFTVIEEFNAPVELPASPVKVPELEAIEATSALPTKRITRDMIQAELGPSSTDNTQQQTPPAESAPNPKPHTEQHKGLHQSLAPSPDDLDYQAEYDSRDPSPRAVEIVCQGDMAAENETVTTVDTSMPTGVDYALGFCAPIDTTISIDETQSKDRFALDADTITLQQQQTKDIDSHQGIQGLPQPEREIEPKTGSKVYSITPISPLKSDEVVKRSSAVSPLHAPTMGIDETLGLGSQDVTMTTNAEEQSETGLYTEDTISPPTPRTLKTYSKSVQLQSNINVSDHPPVNTNRFSLPGDLSTISDNTMCSASDMVTDVAVRFSLPGTTITVGKPQIIDVSAGSTPDKLRFDFGLPQQQILEPGNRTSSVTFADEVAPLAFHKKQEPMRLQKTAETSSYKAKSIIRKPSPCEDLTESSRTTSRDSTTDLRYAGGNLNGITRGFGSHHLPGLKEESIEDVSLTSRNRSSEIASFPLPARIAAVKAMQERRLQDHADTAKARRQARQHNRSIAETRDLPSLNFSRMNLIDKLNHALDLRTTKSMDIVRRRDFTGIHCPSPQRPLSTEPLRDRYTSFFSKPEDFSFFDESEDSDLEDQASEQEHDHEVVHLEQNMPNTETAIVPILQIQEQTEIEGVEPDKRPLSPEDFLNVATQVNRLSIPSVNGLSERLSELIPGLRNLQSLQVDTVLAHDNDQDIDDFRSGRELARPDTVLTSRTSAGFRTLAERAEEIVKNGTHDSIVAAIRALSLNTNKELPALPGSASADMLASAHTAGDVKPAYLSGSVSVPTDLHKDPVRPVSALLSTKTPTTEDEVRQMLPLGLNPIARNARRSMILSHPTSRPWNLDKNYPWSGDEVEIDLSVPDQAHTCESTTKDLRRKRDTRSLDLSAQGETTASSQGVDIGDPGNRLNSTASLTTLQLTSITPQHLRIPSKRSIIGSISKKFGLSGRGLNDEDTTLKSLQSRSPIPRVSSVDQHSHRAGDRYPTSGLTPPATFHIDEVRSFFSDNSSEHGRTASFRKRLTHFKGNKTRSTRQGGPRGHSIDVGDTTYEAGSMAEARLGTNSSANTYDGVGMSKTEFHIKRFGEKLRHLFAKGGDLFRTISVKSRVRGRMDHNQDEWLADSLYSGV